MQGNDGARLVRAGGASRGHQNMRRYMLTAVLCFAGGGAWAFPVSKALDASSLTRVQLVCDHLRCFDPATGFYGRSVCDYRGCRPLGGPVGRMQSPLPVYAPPPPYSDPSRSNGVYYHRRHQPDPQEVYRRRKQMTPSELRFKEMTGGR